MQDLALRTDLIFPRQTASEATLPALLIEPIRNNHLRSYQQLYVSMGLTVQPTTERLCGVVGGVFEGIVAGNSGRASAASVFDAKKIPGISMGDYLVRFAKYSRASLESFVIALIYIDRYIEASPGFFLHPGSCHRLWATALVLAVKMNDDLHLSNEDLAKIGGFGTVELEALESELLRGLQFRLVCDTREVAAYLHFLFF
jgi:hypothetical protein